MRYREQKIRAQKDVISDTIAIYVIEDINGDRFIGEPLTMRKLENDGRYIIPTFSVEDMPAQELMNALWECGIRPSQMRNSSSEIRAMTEHLADLRKIVFMDKEIK